MSTSRSTSRALELVGRYFLYVFIAIVFLVPFIWMVLGLVYLVALYVRNPGRVTDTGKVFLEEPQGASG